MSTLKELFEAVKEENLPLPKLEQYRDQIVHLYSMMVIERADLKKKEALYFMEHKDRSAVANKMEWRVTPEGSRLLDIEAYIRACSKELESLRGRIYAHLT